MLEKGKEQRVLSNPWEAGFMGDVHLFTIMFLLVEIPGTLLRDTECQSNIESNVPFVPSALTVFALSCKI